MKLIPMTVGLLLGVVGVAIIVASTNIVITVAGALVLGTGAFIVTSTISYEGDNKGV